MNITEEWGDPSSHTRHEIKRFADNIGGKTIQDKFNNFMRIQQPNNRITSQTRILSSLILLESLRSLIKTANASSAGFAFEGFLAALMNGRQVADPVDGSLPIEDVMLFTYEDSRSKSQTGVPVSLKLLKADGVVKGSYTNMIDALYGENAFNQGVPYVVAFKTPNSSPEAMKEAQAPTSASKTEDLSLVIYEFIFTPKNLFRVLTATGTAGPNKKYTELNPHRVEKLAQSRPRQVSLIEKLSSTWEAQLANPPLKNKLFKLMLACTQGYSESKFNRLIGPAPIAEKVKPQAQIPQKSESGGSQWKINAKFFAAENKNAVLIGKIDISEKAIYDTAERYIEVLQEGVAVLFEATALLSEDINTYFVAKKRDTGISAGKDAIVQTEKIKKTLNKTMKS